MLTAFVLMRHYAFRAADGPWRRQAPMFVIVNVFGLAQTVLVSLLLAEWLLPALGVQRGAEAIAHAAGVAVPAVTSYFGHRFGSFRR
jgi:putative flippase GtrA